MAIWIPEDAKVIVQASPAGKVAFMRTRWSSTAPPSSADARQARAVKPLSFRARLPRVELGP